MSATLDRVAKALALADAGTTKDERDNAMAMAQKLASLGGIDLAVARAHQADKNKREQPTHRKIQVGDLVFNTRRGYGTRGAVGNKYMVFLFSAIANSNDVTINISPNSDYVIAFGMPSDIDMCQALFTALQVAMVGGAKSGIDAGEHKAEGVNARMYKNHFYEAFTDTIRYRFAQARREAIAEREAELAAQLAEMPADSVEKNETVSLVLHAKSREVSDYYGAHSTARGSYGARGAGGWSDSGRGAGRTAGQKVSLTGARPLEGARRLEGGA